MNNVFTLTADTLDKVIEPTDVLNVQMSHEVFKALLGSKWTREDGSTVTFDSVNVWAEGGRWYAMPLMRIHSGDEDVGKD